MKMLELFKSYPNVEAVKKLLRILGLKKVSSAKDAVTQLIIGRKIGSNGNVRTVTIEPL